jgi:hypothetical protein
MHSCVVRVYRVQEDHPQQLVGVIEQPGQILPLAFGNIDELWAILTAPVGVWRRPGNRKMTISPAGASVTHL